MRHFRPAARAYLLTASAAGALVAVWTLWSPPPASAQQWLAVALFTLLGAVAYLYPVRTGRDGPSYVVAGAFVFAGVVLLPASLLTLLCVVSVIPAAAMDPRPGRLVRGAFNISHGVVAAQLARAILEAAGAQALDQPGHMAWLLLAMVVDLAVSNLAVAMAVALNQGVRLRHVAGMDWKTLGADTLVTILGAVLAMIWLERPWALVLVLVPLGLIYWLLQGMQLVRLVDVDPKTGLYNYRYFERVLREELARARQVNRPVAVLFADLDYLRDVNNRYGHLAGDAVLRQVAETLLNSIRPTDTAARFGGEEFVLILPGTDLEEARWVAERLRTAVAARCFDIGAASPLRCTISLGVACAPAHGWDPAQLVYLADQAVYRAKDLGRDQVCCAVAAAATAVVPPAGATADVSPPSMPAPPPSRPAQPLQLRYPPLHWGVAAVGVAVALGGLWLLLGMGIPGGLMVLLCGAAIAADFVRLHLYSAGRQPTSITPLVILTTAAAVITGPDGAVLTGVTGAVAHLVVSRQRTPWKIALNLSAIGLSAFAAGHVYAWLGGPPDITLNVLGAALAATVANFAVNSGLMALVLGPRTVAGTWAFWRDRFGWLAPHFVFLGMFGAVAGIAYQLHGWAGALLFSVPALVLRYSFRLYAEHTQGAISELETAKAELEALQVQQHQRQEQLIEAVAAMMDARDVQVWDHSRQVARYAVALAVDMGLPADAVDRIKIAALLHDLGKIGIPEAILHKPARLTPQEYQKVKEHAAVGERILAAVEGLQDVARMVGEHHEHFNGRGYPRAKRAEEISIGGRIIAVADALDSMISDRPYARAKSLHWAREEFRRCAGEQFDPMVVAALERVADREGAAFFRAPLPGAGALAVAN